MTDTLQTPFVIGQEFWTFDSCPQQVSVPCPVCAGERAVTIILGTGEHVRVECDGCGLGFDGPRGHITEYSYEPKAHPFVVERVESFRHDKFNDRDEWRLVAVTGETAYRHDLYDTEADALAAATKQAAAAYEQARESQQRRKSGAKKLTWRVRYHREQITDLERQIAWHTRKVSTLQARLQAREPK